MSIPTLAMDVSAIPVFSNPFRAKSENQLQLKGKHVARAIVTYYITRSSGFVFSKAHVFSESRPTKRVRAAAPHDGNEIDNGS